MKKEEVIMMHIEGLPGSQYKERVVYTNDWGRFRLRCEGSKQQDENGDDIWYPIKDENTQLRMLQWAIISLMENK